MFEDALGIVRKCEKGKNEITGLESLKKHLRKVHDFEEISVNLEAE